MLWEVFYILGAIQYTTAKIAEDHLLECLIYCILGEALLRWMRAGRWHLTLKKLKSLQIIFSPA